MSGESREGSPDWLRSFKAPAAPCSLVSLSSDSDSSPIGSLIKEKDAVRHREQIQQPSVRGPSADAILIDSGDESLENKNKEVDTVEKGKNPRKAGKQATPRTYRKQTTTRKGRKQATDDKMKEESGEVNEQAKDDNLEEGVDGLDMLQHDSSLRARLVQHYLGDKPENGEVNQGEAAEEPVTSNASSRLPLMLSDKVQRLKALIECDGESIDLSGDVGAVGRVVISSNGSGNHEMLLDLKGTVYQSTIVPSRTFCVVSFGQTEAKIEAIMNDFVQLKPHSDVFEAETMIEGTLDGFTFDMEDEGNHRVSTLSSHKGGQDDKTGDHVVEKDNGEVEKSQGGKRKKATVAVRPPKKVARKPQALRKTRTSKK